MLPVGWLVLAVVVAVLLTMWVTFTITRLDRLHARVDAAQAALDAQLVRRAAALQHVVDRADTATSAAEGGPVEAHRVRVDRFAQQAQQALDAGAVGAGGPGGLAGGAREAAENAVGRAVTELSGRPDLLAPAASAELRETAARVLIARRFYNDAVRDTRALRARRMPQLLHLAGHRELPEFFDIDDTLPAAPVNDDVDVTLDPVPSPPPARDESGKGFTHDQHVPPFS